MRQRSTPPLSPAGDFQCSPVLQSQQGFLLSGPSISTKYTKGFLMTFLYMHKMLLDYTLPCYFPFLFLPMMVGLPSILVPVWGLACLNLFLNWSTGWTGCVKLVHPLIVCGSCEVMWIRPSLLALQRAQRQVAAVKCELTVSGETTSVFNVCRLQTRASRLWRDGMSQTLSPNCLTAIYPQPLHLT